MFDSEEACVEEHQTTRKSEYHQTVAWVALVQIQYFTRIKSLQEIANLMEFLFSVIMFKSVNYSKLDIPFTHSLLI